MTSLVRVTTILLMALFLLDVMSTCHSSTRLKKRNVGLFLDPLLASRENRLVDKLRGFWGAAASQYVDVWNIFKVDLSTICRGLRTKED